MTGFRPAKSSGAVDRRRGWCRRLVEEHRRVAAEVVGDGRGVAGVAGSSTGSVFLPGMSPEPGRGIVGIARRLGVRGAVLAVVGEERRQALSALP
jgi:hypothetical protein